VRAVARFLPYARGVDELRGTNGEPLELGEPIDGGPGRPIRPRRPPERRTLPALPAPEPAPTPDPEPTPRRYTAPSDGGPTDYLGRAITVDGTNIATDAEVIAAVAAALAELPSGVTLASVQAAIAAAADTDAEREAFIPSRLSAAQLRAASVAAVQDAITAGTIKVGADTGTLVQSARSMPPPSRIISRFASGHGWTSGTDDTAVKLYGDRSYRGTTNGAGGSLYLSSPTFAAQDWSKSYVRVVARIDIPTRVATFQVWADSAGGSWVAGWPGTLARVDDWTVFTLPRSAFTVGTGTPDWTAITAVRIRFQDKGGSAPIVARLAAVELLPDLAATYPAGVLVLEADDGYANQKNLLRPMLDSLGVPCTINPIVERITGGAAGITVADLQDMQERSGWQISAHAYSQAVHNGPATAAELAADWSAAKAWLHANGLHVGADDYALCPGSGTDATITPTVRALLRNYWRSARMFSGFQETVVPGDVMCFRSIGYSGNGNAQLQTNIDQAAAPGGVFHLSLHDVVAGATNGASNGLPAIGVTNLQTVLNYALGKGMVARTRGDWLEGR